jgi:hypothetical protein
MYKFNYFYEIVARIFFLDRDHISIVPTPLKSVVFLLIKFIIFSMGLSPHFVIPPK